MLAHVVDSLPARETACATRVPLFTCAISVSDIILSQIAQSSIILKNASFLEKRHPMCKLVLMFSAAAAPLLPAASSPLI